MVSMLKHLPLALLSLVACGPGTNTTDSSTSNTTTDTTGTAAGTATEDPTATGATTGTTDAPTGSEPTSVDPTTATTTSDSTTVDPTATTGGDDCSGVFEDGDPCTSEGLICGGPCEDPCSFCNLSKCENGMWMQLEVFPANCLDCESVCNLVVPAACNAGPPDQENCVTGCMATQNGECGIVYNESLACIGDMPTFTCDEDGHPTVIGCADQFAALYECLG